MFKRVVFAHQYVLDMQLSHEESADMSAILALDWGRAALRSRFRGTSNPSNNPVLLPKTL